MIIGTGIDIIEIDRIKKAIDRWGESFIEFVFHPDEIKSIAARKDPVQHYAARFAAKEAVFKAIGTRPEIGWKDIKILNDDKGKPICEYSDKNYPYKILVSISHSDHYAVAQAIITSK